MRCYICPLCNRYNAKNLIAECRVKGEVNDVDGINCDIGERIMNFTQYQCLKAKNEMVDKMVHIVELMANK